MMESEIAPVDEELQSLAHLVTRQHAIVLCCAHSVAELVEEVARNLGGLGFDVDVVCGAEARSALLGRNDRRDEPTIYVVCVQGTLKEQVLKPLRQALATHGGPNQHLFVAVLDLALPLAMVGQIRRFAEALERPAGKGGGINERRQWREHIGPNGSDRVPTRAYRAVDVLERTGAHPTVDAALHPRTGPQTVIGSARPAKVGVTAKYRAVTGQLPAVTAEPEPEPAGRRRRKTHAPKVRVKPIAPARGRRGRGSTGEVEAASPSEPLEPGVPVAIEPLEPLASDDDPSVQLAAGEVASGDIDATMTASWGLDDLDTVVRPRAPVPPLPPARTGDTVIAPARTGDTVIAPAPTAAAAAVPATVDAVVEVGSEAPKPAPPKPEPSTRRSDTVLYVEASEDEAVLMPTSEPEPASPTARGNTVIGQPPTRFRATPVSLPPRGNTLVGSVPPPPTVVAPKRDTIVGTPPPTELATVRGETVVAPAPSSDASPTARGETVVAPAPSSEPSPTARGETVLLSPTARGETVLLSPTARGETVVAPAPASDASPTARGETVVAPTREASPTARGETVLESPGAYSLSATRDRVDTVMLTPREREPESPPVAARGGTVVPLPTERGGTVVPLPTERGGTVVPLPTERGDTVVAPSRARARTEIPEQPGAPRPVRGADAKSVALVTDAPSVPASDPLVVPQRSKWPLAVGALGIAAAVALAWSLGWFGGGAPERTEATGAAAVAKASTTATSTPPATPPVGDTTTAKPETPTAPAEPTLPTPAAAAPTTPTPSAAEPTPTTPATAAPTEPAAPTPTTAQPTAPTPTTAQPTTPEPTTPEPTTPERTTPEPTTPSVAPADAEPALASALAERRLRIVDDLYVTPTRIDATTWSAARTFCNALEVDGVGGFRLPHRRELQAVDVAGYLRAAPHWSRTTPDDDRESAYVLHPSTGQLTVWYKQESAAVICVRPR